MNKLSRDHRRKKLDARQARRRPAAPQPDCDRVAEAVRREACEKFRKRYNNKEVSMPGLWSEGTEPDTVYPQKCFYRAYLFCSALGSRLSDDELNGVYLVHGECCLALGPHAWVELPGDLLFDGVFQRFYRLSLCDAAAWYKYTPRAADIICANMPVDAKTNMMCYAFYHPLRLPWGDPSNPLIIDYDKAIELLVTSGLRPDLEYRLRKNGSHTGA